MNQPSQEEFGFMKEINDPKLEEHVAIYKGFLDIIETGTPDEVLNEFIKITTPKGANLGLNEILPHLDPDDVEKFNEIKRIAIDFAFKRLAYVISQINADEANIPIFKPLVKDAEKLVKNLETIEARDYLSDEEKNLLVERKKALKSRTIEFAPLDEEIEQN